AAAARPMESLRIISCSHSFGKVVREIHDMCHPEEKALLDLLTLQGMRQRDQVKELNRAELGAEVHGPVVPWDPPAGTKDVLRHSRLPQGVCVFSQRLKDRAVSIDFVELDEVPYENPLEKPAVALPVFE